MKKISVKKRPDELNQMLIYKKIVPSLVNYNYWWIPTNDLRLLWYQLFFFHLISIPSRFIPPVCSNLLLTAVESIYAWNLHHQSKEVLSLNLSSWMKIMIECYELCDVMTASVSCRQILQAETNKKNLIIFIFRVNMFLFWFGIILIF